MTHAAPARWHGLDAVRGFALVAGVVLHASMAILPGPQLWLVADATRSTTLSVAVQPFESVTVTVTVMVEVLTYTTVVFPLGVPALHA